MASQRHGASSIAEFARRLPSAGLLYTCSSRGLGWTGGFLTRLGAVVLVAYLGIRTSSSVADCEA